MIRTEPSAKAMNRLSGGSGSGWPGWIAMSAGLDHGTGLADSANRIVFDVPAVKSAILSRVVLASGHDVPGPVKHWKRVVVPPLASASRSGSSYSLGIGLSSG